MQGSGNGHCRPEQYLSAGKVTDGQQAPVLLPYPRQRDISATPHVSSHPARRQRRNSAPAGHYMILGQLLGDSNIEWAQMGRYLLEKAAAL